MAARRSWWSTSRSARTSTGPSPRRAAASRRGAGQYLFSSDTRTGTSWELRRGRRGGSRDLHPRALLGLSHRAARPHRLLGRRRPHRLGGDTAPSCPAGCARPGLRSHGGAGARDRAGHGWRLRPEDACAPRGSGRGGAGAGGGAPRQVGGDAPGEPRRGLPRARGAGRDLQERGGRGGRTWRCARASCRMPAPTISTRSRRRWSRSARRGSCRDRTASRPTRIRPSRWRPASRRWAPIAASG